MSLPVRILLPAALLAAALQAREAAACDFCAVPGVGFRSVQSEVETHSAVALARARGRASPGRTLFAIERVLKDDHRLLAGGAVTVKTEEVPFPVLPYLLLNAGPDPSTMRVVALNNRTAEFAAAVMEAPPAKKPVARLAFFLPYLRGPDPWIAASARQEFAVATNADVKRLKPDLSPDEILAWLASPATPKQSRGILFLLLGVSGSDRHAAQLERWMTSPVWQRASGFDGLVGAYLLLRKADGLPTVLSMLAAAEEPSRERIGFAVLRALRFHEGEKTSIPRKKIVATLRKLLRYPEFAAGAISELNRLEDWDSLERIVELYERHSKTHPWLAASVGGFLFACPRPEAEAQLDRLIFKRNR